MLLLSRPPYLRWFVAVMVLVAAVGWDLSARATEPFPFASVDIPKGDAVGDDSIEWRDMPVGAIALPDLIGVVATSAITAGDPLTRSVVSPLSPIPDGWWSVPVALPAGVVTGTRVRLTTLDGLEVDGLVSIAPSQDAFGVGTTGTVAVPEPMVGAISLAVATDTLLVVVAP